MKKMYKVLSSTALAAALLSGTIMGSIETAAAKNAAAGTAAQSGITLSISKAFYDGNYISLTVKRSGKGLSGGMTGGAKGTINSMDILIDGKSISSYGKTPAQRPSLGWKAEGTDTAVITLADASWLGGSNKAFPDKFKLTAKIGLEGVSKPYTFNIPLQKSSKTNVLKPNVTKKSGDLSMTLKQVRAADTSIRLQWVLKGKDKDQLHDLMYDFVDSKGNKIDFITGSGTDENNKNGDYYYDYILGGLGSGVKSITIKPFTAEMKDDESGQFKTDAKGEIVKNYNKELEITVSVK
ncbi:DUF5643 domain-containing protein [Paenibacillus terreus]|uniref:DUF5643 domain-containing protein n=1 Tax=Paenibacillus terreus TaxID=1387834 RepID=A0ABV5BB64_9BACL